MSDHLADLQQRDQVPAASPSPEKAPVVRRKLWHEETTRSLLGEEGYAWFVESAERKLSNCTRCNGSGSVVIPDPSGIRRGAPLTNPCPVCSTRVENLTAFTKTYFEVVPRAYRRFTLRTLQPYPASPVPTERQERVIADLKANPDKNYAFFAPAGAGKTVLATALFSEMPYRHYQRPPLRWKWFPVRRISAKALLDQHSQWVNGRHSENLVPEVTSRKIAEATTAGQTYRLFLEDVNGEDSAARRAALFDVLNTLMKTKDSLLSPVALLSLSSATNTATTYSGASPSTARSSTCSARKRTGDETSPAP